MKDLSKIKNPPNFKYRAWFALLLRPYSSKMVSALSLRLDGLIGTILAAYSEYPAPGDTAKLNWTQVYNKGNNQELISKQYSE